MTTLRRVAFLTLGIAADVLYTVALAIQPRPLRKPEQPQTKPSVADRFPTALRVRGDGCQHPEDDRVPLSGDGWMCVHCQADVPAPPAYEPKPCGVFGAFIPGLDVCDHCECTEAEHDAAEGEKSWRAVVDNIEQAEIDAMRETIQYARRDADWCIAARPTDSEGVARAQRVIEWAEGRIREIEQTQEPEYGARDGRGWLSRGGAA